jgi:hypothetical protein
MQAINNIVELRQLLTERFPRSHLSVSNLLRVETCPTGVPALDTLLNGGLMWGEFTELISDSGSASAQIIHALLHRVARDGQFLALVDGADSFDVGAVESDVLARLLWVRCANVNEALKATDILLRDHNFPLVVLDLKLNPLNQLRKIPASTWHRYGRLLEQSHATVLVIAPIELVTRAACRVRLHGGLGLEALSQSPTELLLQLRFTMLRGPVVVGDESAAKAC